MNKEEEIIILYALNCCGGAGSKARIIFFIKTNGPIKQMTGDTDRRQNGEYALENDFAFSRENLKEKRQLSMPKHGYWQITDLGRERLFRVVGAIHAEKPGAELFRRYTEKFITEMYELGEKLAAMSP